jgi:hypothetical protein
MGSRPTTTFRFGPGSLEALTLTVWAGTEANGRRAAARVSGNYRVYCGQGNEHQVAIAESYSGSEDDAKRSGNVYLLFRCACGDASAAHSLAAEAVEAALDNWADPCES